MLFCQVDGRLSRTIGQGGVRVNGDRVTSTADPVAAVDGRFVLVQKGKKQRHLVVVDDH